MIGPLSLRLRRLAFPCLSAFISLLFGCSEDPSSVGNTLFPKNIRLDSLTVFSDSTATYRFRIPGNSTTLLLGRYQNYDAKLLLDFGLPSLPSGARMTGAKLKLIPTYWYKDSVGLLQFEVHKIQRSWSSSTTTFDSLTTDFYSLNAYNTVTRVMSPRDTLVDTLSVGLIQEWIDSGRALGMILVPTPSSTVVYGFISYVDLFTDIRPQLVISYMLSDTSGTDSLVYLASQDVFVADGPVPASSTQSFIVQAAIADRGFIHFDVGSIPQSATIAKADLEFVRDPLSSVRNELSYDSVFVQFVTKSGPPPAGSFSVMATPGQEDSSVFAGDMRTIVQQWVTGAPNYGVSIRPFGEFVSFDRFAFFGSGNTQNRPKLKIIYTYVP